MPTRTEKFTARDAIPFPVRWFDTLGALDAPDLKTMFDAIAAYAKNGEAPEFSGIMAALWNEFRQRIDCDREKYEAVCARNREHVLKRWAKKGMPDDTTVCGGMRPDTENTDADAEADADADADAEAEEIKAPGGAFRPAAPEPSGAPGTTRTRRRENIFFDYDGDRKIHGITAEQLAMWQENFPAVDVPGELRKAAVWLDANRRNRKHDLKRFLAGWLTRARDDTANAGHNGSRDFELGVTVLDREFRWGENERG